MLISGTYLPAPPQSVSERERRYADQQDNSLAQRQRRQASEFIFRGVIEDDRVQDEFQRVPNYQQIDPANRGAILSYTDTATASPGAPERKGRLLDIFL